MIETLVMTMCTTSVMARIMVKQDLHMHGNDKSHNVTRPCATKFAPEAATTQNLVETTNIFMQAAAVGISPPAMAVICLTTAAPPPTTTATAVFFDND